MSEALAPQRLHHTAYLTKDQAATRAFYEDLIGLPLVATWSEQDELFGALRVYCHTFFGLPDGSALAFFQFAEPEDHEELVLNSADSLNHVALATDSARQDQVRASLDGAGIDHRTVDHGYCTSLYVLDPDGLTVEFTVDASDAAAIDEWQRRDAHRSLERWLDGDHTLNNDVRGRGEH